MVSIRLRRRLTAACAAVLAIAPGAATLSLAEDYPSGPVQVLVAYAAGGGTDTLARLIATPLSKALGQPVVVQNLPGGGGQVAATTLLRDGADGLALLATNQPDLSISTVFNKPPYKIGDFQIIEVDVQDPRIMLVQKELAISTLADFIAKAKAEPGKVAVSVTQGGAQELFAKWLFAKLGLNIRIVGYNGGGAAANAMLAGDVVATVGDDFARFNLRDKSKALFVAAAAKSPRWPEAPTLASALPPSVSMPSPDFLARYGVYVVPAAFKAKHPDAYRNLQQALIQAREAPEFQAYLAKNQLKDLSIGRPGEDYDAAFADDFAEIEKLKP